MKLIYIAGKLNDDAPGYVKHIHNMIKFAEEVRQLGYHILTPCNDIITGLIIGTYDYNDYSENNMELLSRCDGMALVPGWETSKGTVAEIKQAEKLGIPIFYTLKDLEMNK